MSDETFEEIAAREIDGLYQEALFLAGGAEEAAEELLSRTFARSFQAFTDPEGGKEDAGRWLEGRLVREFLESAGGREALRESRKGPGWADGPRISGNPPDPDAMDPMALYRAAAEIPPGPRAVLWLILFGRWPYGEVEDLLGIERDFLRDLMRYRHVLLAELLHDGWGRAGGRAAAVN